MPSCVANQSEYGVDKAQLDSDPMPENDPEALVAWGKRNIQK
jgi:hypothetical protein